ncbi:MAG: hypothetical protein KAJ19_09895, partial [Gammaproteobacteria bacterium]|nr:hypothetical protein [Gammaproteobacteria bacterium]
AVFKGGPMESYMPIRHRSNTSSPLRIKAIVSFIILLVFIGVSCSEDPVIIIPDEEIQKETRIIADINYVDNTYFFLDSPYGPFIQPKVGEIEVFVSVTPIERQQNPELHTHFGLAFVDTTAQGGAIRAAKAAFEAGQETPPREEAYFRRLIFGTDYRYVLDVEDESFVGIELIRRIEDSKVLAVRYVNEYGDTIGDYAQYPVGFPGEEENYPIFLEVIKPRNPRPTSQLGYTWDFMMRCIYNLGLTDIDAPTLEIEIEDLSINIINTHPEGETVPYIRIFGLDRSDEYGDPEPDNRIDLQAGLIDFNRGLLTFPSLRPFDPNINDVERWTEGDDSFIVPDDYVNLNLANPIIYDEYLTGTDLQQARRYNIVVRVIGKCPCGGTGLSIWNSQNEGTTEIPATGPWLEDLR